MENMTSNQPHAWDSLSALRAGTPRQRAAYRALVELDIFEQLAPYDPVVAGTLPLRIDTPTSDLDILCHAPDVEAFAADLCHAYGRYPGFAVRRTRKDDLPVMIGTFTYTLETGDAFPIEFFGQPRASRRQRAYLHMLAEWRLLETARQLDGGVDGARQRIRALKRQGVKTEPAFGQYFCLAGDPYERLLTLAHADDAQLVQIVRHAWAKAADTDA